MLRAGCVGFLDQAREVATGTCAFFSLATPSKSVSKATGVAVIVVQAITIPAKVMALRFPTFKSARVLMKNEIAEASIRRA